MFNMAEWVGKPINCGSHDDNVINDPWLRMAAEIVIHAVDDWRSLIKRGAWQFEERDRYCNFDELRIFFTGDWCAFIMQDFDIDPARILKILEAELQEAMWQPARKKGGGRRGRIR